MNKRQKKKFEKKGEMKKFTINFNARIAEYNYVVSADIKNSKLKNTLKGEVKYYMGMIDVAPTILNMLGYKNEYALGHDIFNIKNNNVVAFPNGNFLSSVMYYNNSTGEYYVINDSTVIDDNYVDKTKESVEKMLEVSNSIIVYDLLNKKESSND